MDKKALLFEMEINTEYLDTTTGDVIPCISIENMTGILREQGIITKEEELEQNNKTR